MWTCCGLVLFQTQRKWLCTLLKTCGACASSKPNGQKAALPSLRDSHLALCKCMLACQCQSCHQQQITPVQDAEGVLDVLVNNAGVLEEWLPINESDTEVWWNTWELNLRSLYLMTKAVLPAMLQRGAGTIINTTSAGGLRTAPGASAYQGSKTAVIR